MRQAATHSGAISLSPSLLPPYSITLQLCSTSGYELRGTLTRMILLPSFCMLLCPSYLQLSPFVHQKQQGLSLNLFIAFAAAFKRKEKSNASGSHLYKRGGYLEITIPFDINDQFKCQTMNNLSCGLTLAQNPPEYIIIELCRERV